MSETFKTSRRVEFCETDAAGIAHFSAILCYMEQAEHALMRSLGESIVRELPGEEGWHLSWPRVHVECDYIGAAKFEDELTLEVAIERLGAKSVTYCFNVLKGTQPIATGQLVAVCCKVNPGLPLQSATIPADLVVKLKRFLRES